MKHNINFLFQTQKSIISLIIIIINILLDERIVNASPVCLKNDSKKNGLQKQKRQNNHGQAKESGKHIHQNDFSSFVLL